jgi:hypothetical protein
MPRARTVLLAILCAFLLLPGCGGGSGTVKVEGVVFFAGQPLPRASVLFLPEAPGGRDARGFTDKDGKFRLSTFQSGDGALPGNYKVVIQYSEEVAPAAGLKTPAEIQRGLGTGKPPAPSLTLPPAYSQPDKTVLRQRVPAQGPVKFDLYPDGRAPASGVEK